MTFLEKVCFGGTSEARRIIVSKCPAEAFPGAPCKCREPGQLARIHENKPIFEMCRECWNRDADYTAEKMDAMLTAQIALTSMGEQWQSGGFSRVTLLDE